MTKTTFHLCINSSGPGCEPKVFPSVGGQIHPFDLLIILIFLFVLLQLFHNLNHHVLLITHLLIFVPGVFLLNNSPFSFSTSIFHLFQRAHPPRSFSQPKFDIIPSSFSSSLFIDIAPPPPSLSQVPSHSPFPHLPARQASSAHILKF